MNKILIVFLIILLSGCETYQFSDGGPLAVDISRINIRAPMRVKIETNSDDVKRALLSSGVFHEENSSTRVLKVNVDPLYYGDIPFLSLIASFCTAYIIPFTEHYPIYATIKIKEKHNVLAEFEYMLDRKRMTSWLPFGRGIKDSNEEMGAIIASNVISDLSKKGLL